jgi:hypothetical protein
MPNRRLSIRKIKEILHLKWELGLAARQIAHSLSISHSTVLDMLRRAERAGIAWPLPDLDDAALESQLYPGNPDPGLKRPEADMAYIHHELRRKGVTLQLLWWEHKQAHPGGSSTASSASITAMAWQAARCAPSVAPCWRTECRSTSRARPSL